MGNRLQSYVDRGLDISNFVCANYRFVIKLNVDKHHVIYNGLTGVVENVVYIPKTPSTGLPAFVWVVLEYHYRCSFYFLNIVGQIGWVPVHPLRGIYRGVSITQGQCSPQTLMGMENLGVTG